MAGGGGWSGAKGGDFGINAPSQQVLERNSCLTSQEIGKEKVLELRFSVGLPAAGRRILGQKASDILTVRLPQLVQKTMLWQSLDNAHLMKHIKSVEDQDVLRNSLEKMSLIAFVGNGSVLPRASGSSALPMSGPDVIPFQSPQSLQVAMNHPRVLQGLLTSFSR